MTSRVALLDVNVLVALTWPAHTHHRIARRWFFESRAGPWASCAITEIGCVRVLALPSVSFGQIKVPQSASLVRDLLENADHVWWNADIRLTDPLLAEATDEARNPNQVTDLYLLALAAKHDGILATFDRSIGAALPANSSLSPHLEVIPL